MNEPPAPRAFPVPSSAPRETPVEPLMPPAWQETDPLKPRRDRRMLAALVAGGVAFAAVAAVVVVVAVRGGGEADYTATATEAGTAPVFGTTGVPPVTTSRRTTTTTSAPPSQRTTTVTSGFQRVPGPNGISAEIPLSWEVKPGGLATHIEAGNPDSPGDLVRIGGSTSVAIPLLDSVAGNETQNSGIGPGYQRIRLERVNGDPNTVAWEFTYLKDGASRHSYGRFWRRGGIDYIVYGSASTATWPAMKSVLDVVVRTATPV